MFINLLWLVVITSLWALAVKQVAYALKDGSVFQWLRSFIYRGSEKGWLGFFTLNQLFTCKLCMSVQVSLWLVFLPALKLVWDNNLLQGISGSWWMVTLIVGIYALAISAIAQGLWTWLEFPEYRYQAANFEVIRLRKLVQRCGDGEISSQANEVSDDSIRTLMKELNKCAKIGCGYSRRECREDAVDAWMKSVGGLSPMQENQLLYILRGKFSASTSGKLGEADLLQIKEALK